MNIYDTCVSLCEQKGISLAEMCKSAGVSHSTVEKWKGPLARAPHIQNLRGISVVLGVSVLSLLYPDVRVVNGVYTRADTPITDIPTKLGLLAAINEFGLAEFADYCGVEERALYRWIRGELNIALDKCEKVARATQVPVHILLDENVPLNANGYLKSEVDACSVENIRYSLSAMVGISAMSRREFCTKYGINVTTLRKLMTGGLVQSSSVPKVAKALGVSIEQLVTDYTRSAEVHEAFIAMSTIERMHFMMLLKGVTPKYVRDVFSWRDKDIFSIKHSTMTMEIPYIMAQYFQCPNAWFTRQTIELEPGQTLITDWNTII